MKNKYQSCFLHKHFASCPILRLFTVLVIFQGKSPESIIVQYVYDFTLYEQRWSSVGNSFLALSTYASRIRRNWPQLPLPYLPRTSLRPGNCGWCKYFAFEAVRQYLCNFRHETPSMSVYL